MVLKTLVELAGIASEASLLVFDYMDADAFDPARAGKRIRLMQNIARMVGEPMKTGFDPRALSGDLERVGLLLLENLGPAEIEALYFQNRGDEYHAFEHVHFAKAMIKTA